MIHRVFSSTLSSFKELNFHQGLNVLLSEKSTGATERQTRNAAGKSSMVEIVHFLLGSDCNKKSIFLCPDLITHRFGLKFDLTSSQIEVERAGQEPSRIIINKGDTSSWPVASSLDKKTGEIFLSNTKWKEILGKIVFGISTEWPRFSPTFRSLISYFARRMDVGGFKNPKQQSEKQAECDQQVAISFLLDIDWDIPREIEEVRQKENSLKILKRELKSGVLGSVIGTASSLKTKLTIVERRFKKLQQEINSFHVLPEYRELEHEASELVLKINDLSNQNVIDEESIREIEEAISSEKPPKQTEVRKIYKEAGIVLPDIALKRLEDVERFHSAIVSNRRSHLKGELDTLRNKIDKRRREMEKIDQRRRQNMEILNTHGALDQSVKLQQELNRLHVEVEELRRQHEIAEKIETTGADLSIERKQLYKRLIDDYKEQEELLKEAIITFEDLSSELSEREGSLTITPTERGPEFDVQVEAKRSRGITNMQIFCFDMMLIVLCQKRKTGPGFLIHDSHLFDGMDSRQVAKAIEIGARTAEEHKFQYIVTMNSDMVPFAEFSKNFRFNDYVLPVKLTDATVDGGLFGFRFD